MRRSEGISPELSEAIRKKAEHWIDARERSSDEVRAMLAGNANRIADGEPPLEPSEPRGSALFTQPLALARVHQYLSMAMTLLFTRQADTFGALGLALNACSEPDGHVQELGRIRELLTVAADLWSTMPDAGDEAAQRRVARTTARLIHLADILAVTTSA